MPGAGAGAGRGQVVGQGLGLIAHWSGTQPLLCSLGSSLLSPQACPHSPHGLSPQSPQPLLPLCRWHLRRQQRRAHGAPRAASGGERQTAVLSKPCLHGRQPCILSLQLAQVGGSMAYSACALHRSLLADSDGVHGGNMDPVAGSGVWGGGCAQRVGHRPLHSQVRAGRGPGASTCDLSGLWARGCL